MLLVSMSYPLKRENAKINTTHMQNILTQVLHNNVWYVYGFGRSYVFRIAKQLIFTIIGVYSTSRFSLELSQEISV